MLLARCDQASADRRAPATIYIARLGRLSERGEHHHQRLRRARAIPFSFYIGEVMVHTQELERLSCDLNEMEHLARMCVIDGELRRCEIPYECVLAVVAGVQWLLAKFA